MVGSEGVHQKHAHKGQKQVRITQKRSCRIHIIYLEIHDSMLMKPEGAVTQEKVHRFVQNFIVKCDIPLHIVNHKDFISLVQLGRPGIKMIPRKKVCTNYNTVFYLTPFIPFFNMKKPVPNPLFT